MPSDRLYGVSVKAFPPRTVVLGPALAGGLTTLASPSSRGFPDSETSGWEWSVKGRRNM